LEGAEERQLQPNQVLLKEGDDVHVERCLFVVGNGYLIAKKGDFTMPLYQDQIVGEISFLLGGPPTATVTASSVGATVYVISATKLAKKVQNPTSEIAFYSYLAQLIYRRIKSTLEFVL
jgi:CRP-like cAMP-binding protein